MNVAFPLRDGYFPPLQATPEDRARWTRRVREHVQQSLEEEKPFFASGYEAIDRRQWKLVRRKDQLRVFRPRREGSGSSQSTSDGERLPCLLEIGTIEGSLEDVIYGVHSASTHDMRTTTAFLSADALDAAVLGVFENGSRDDLYRSFALKWRILETPAGSLVKNRDVLALEYMGISRDADGERFAFHICDSFDHPACPPFHAQCSVRARTHTRIIYRQVRPGRVGVYYRGEYTSGGRIPKLLARWTAAEVAVSIGRSVECAEAKKLTAIAIAAHGSEASKRAVERRARGFSGSARACSICDQHAAHKALQACDVCGAQVCARCRSRKFLLSDEGKVQVACCKQCIVAAKTMRVDARQPLGIISAAYWHGYGAIVSATAPPARIGASFAEEHDDIGDCDAVAVNRASSVASQATVRPRARTVERQQPYYPNLDDNCDEQKPRSTRSDWKREMDRRRTREDVYELLAAMSTASESTVESMASRDDASVVTSDSFLDFDDDVDSPRAETKRKASRVVPMAVPVARPQLAVAQPASELSNEDTAHPLWLQMKQLRVAAEQTYHITKKTSENFVR